MSAPLILELTPHPHLTHRDQSFRCAIGKAGIAHDKKEGDHKTPAGTYKLLHLYYRADKIETPPTILPVTEITPDLGWCDDPAYPDYNKAVALPFPGSHEKMWRDDDLYDIVIEISHNHSPSIPGKGSAVFIHIAKEKYEGTEGCIALKKEDLIQLLAENPSSIVIPGEGEE